MDILRLTFLPVPSISYSHYGDQRWDRPERTTQLTRAVLARARNLARMSIAETHATAWAQMDWNDLRYVLAIARGSGLKGAARLLGVNVSSVYRRLDSLEHKMQTKLFERGRDRYRLTAAGAAMAESAGRMEAEALALERRVHGRDRKLEGVLRVSMGEPEAFFMFPPHLQAFRRAYPGIQLEVSVNNAFVDLARGDADLVIRGTRQVPELLAGRSLGMVGWAAYASRDYLQGRGSTRTIDQHVWLALDRRLSRLTEVLRITALIPPAAIVCQFDSLGALHAAAAAGVGCAVLPCFACEHDARLVQIPDTYEESGHELWILTHPDSRKSVRVRAFLQFFGTRLANVGIRRRPVGYVPSS